MTITKSSQPARAPRPRQVYQIFPLALALLLAVLAVQIPPVQGWAAEPREKVLEDLQYQVNAFICEGAAKAWITFKGLGDNRYRADLEVAYQGIFGVLSGQRRDHFQTEMLYRDGRLLPVVYREETRWRNKKKYRLKEYRFDYTKARLELWSHHQGKGLLHQWETSLKGQAIFDPLSAFYNFRLGGFGPKKEGETLKIAGIPYPHPDEIVIRIGGKSQEERKVMISFINRAFNNEQGVVYIFFDKKWTPVHAYTQVLSFGKVVGQMLPGGKPLDSGLASRSSGLEALAFGQ